MVNVLTRDEVSRRIARDPSTVYELVADVTRTPEFSPEIVKCTWLTDGGPVVGARFRAVNKVRRGPSWHNDPEVIAAEPGREFAFVRRERFAGELVWRYSFHPDSDGTVVTESYEVTKPVPTLMYHMMRWFFGCPDRPADLRRGMEQTLARIAAAAETTNRV